MVWRIRDRATFEALRVSGRRARRGPITVTYAPVGADPEPRVGYAVGKRVGGAVERNHVRRRLRAAVAEVAQDVPPGVYLVAAGPEAGGIGFEELKRTVAAAMASASEERRS
ncbi:MAG TPA: ribonuclease P protein component [Acidimicrobiales bacterium]|nr:ribonuclease P protein component [Acidimicrobiales bacterium]